MNTKIKSIIESLLFVAGNPISIEDISEFTSLDKVIVVDILDSLKEEKYNDESGIVLIVNDSEAGGSCRGGRGGKVSKIG